MSQSRDAMIAELKRVAVPVLRALGFKGSFPHFRRAADKQIDLLTFQFSAGGGEFVIEIGSFPPAGDELYGELLPAAEVKMRHLLRRLRLGAKDESSDHWFNYDGGDYAGVAALAAPARGGGVPVRHGRVRVAVQPGVRRGRAGEQGRAALDTLSPGRTIRRRRPGPLIRSWVTIAPRGGPGC